MKFWLAMLIIVVAVLCVVRVANGDNYGTTPKQYAASKQMVYDTFGAGWEGRMMVRCMDRESGGNPLAANYHDWYGGSYGLLQLNAVHRWRNESVTAFRQRMWNPRTHLIAAKRLYDASKRAYGNGFQPWGGRC